MKIILLGTGSPLPHPLRAGPSTLVKAGNANLVFDCGRGVLMRLAASGVMPQQISALFLTHMHSDHMCDLNDVLTSFWIMNQEPRQLAVYGPAGTRELVELTIAMLKYDVKYRQDHHVDLPEPPQAAVTEVKPGDQLTFGDVSISVHHTVHLPVCPTVGYRVEHCGRSVVLAGDGIPCPELDAMCAGADVYVQTVIRDDLIRKIPSRRLQDVLDYHSTVAQAAQTAARAGVGTLMMTHCVPPVLPGQEAEWRGLAAAHFAGEIVLGDDLTAVTLPPR